MKIHKQEAAFQPITIVLESQEEVDCLLICLNTTTNDFHVNAATLDLTNSRIKNAAELFGTMFNQVEDLY